MTIRAQASNPRCVIHSKTLVNPRTPKPLLGGAPRNVDLVMSVRVFTLILKAVIRIQLVERERERSAPFSRPPNPWPHLTPESQSPGIIQTLQAAAAPPLPFLACNCCCRISSQSPAPPAVPPLTCVTAVVELVVKAAHVHPVAVGGNGQNGVVVRHQLGQAVRAVVVLLASDAVAWDQHGHAIQEHEHPEELREGQGGERGGRRGAVWC